MSLDWASHLSLLGNDLRPSALTDLLQYLTEPGIISFSGGLPHPATFPVPEIKEVVNYIMEQEYASALQYGSTQGYDKLLRFLAERSKNYGIQATAENLLITSGSQQGLDLLARLLLDPGDEVIVESPTYLGALGPFDNIRVKFTEVPMDDDGIRVDVLEDILAQRRQIGKKIKFIYLIPTFQNPTGVTLSAERRRALVELAGRYDTLIIEDDPYSELRYAGEAVPPIKSLDTEGRVIYMSTFSKIFSPGARLAWIIADKALINKLVYLKESVDLHTSTFTQAIVYEYSRRNYLDPHIQKILPLYAVRREAMLQAMAEYFPAETVWTKPEGGFFLWVTLPEKVNTKDIFPVAAANKVCYVPGYAFYPDGKGMNTMRLCFSATTPEQIKAGIKSLSEVVRSQL